MNFQLTSIQEKLSENEAVIIYMVVNGKCANSAMSIDCFKNKELAKSTLIAAVNSLINKCYGDE